MLVSPFGVLSSRHDTLVQCWLDDGPALTNRSMLTLEILTMHQNIILHLYRITLFTTSIGFWSNNFHGTKIKKKSAIFSFVAHLNCDSNSLFVVDVDDIGKFRLERVRDNIEYKVDEYSDDVPKQSHLICIFFSERKDTWLSHFVSSFITEEKDTVYADYGMYTRYMYRILRAPCSPQTYTAQCHISYYFR